MDKELLKDEQLNIVSGGVLLDGWDTTLLSIIRIYKAKYGEEGKQKVKDLMLMSLNDPTSPIEPQDMETIMNFIDENWDLA